MAFASAVTAASEMRCLWCISNERVLRRVSLSLFARLCGIKVGFRPQEVFSVQGSQLENTRGI